MQSGHAKLSHRNLPLMLLQARERVIVKFRPILNAHGITEQQWRIVRALMQTGPLEPRQIGELCNISSPSLAGVLSRMQELRYVKRRRLKHDQRRVLISLAARSRVLAARLAPQIEATYRSIEAALGEQFSASFYAALDHLIDTLRAPEAPAVKARKDSR